VPIFRTKNKQKSGVLRRQARKWRQLEGRRTVIVGPPVRRGTPLDIETPAPAGEVRWATFDLDPGSLFSLPPRTPHEVVCHARSLALSFTWARGGRPRQSVPGARTESLARWDVASGRVSAMPRRHRDRLWTQVPVLAGPLHRHGRTFTLWTPDGPHRLPSTVRPLVARLTFMPVLRASTGRARPTLRHVTDLGILAPHDLPLRIVPEDPRALDGWDFG